MRIVPTVIIVLALASPARLARAGDQGEEAQHGAHTGATSSAFVEEVRRATAPFRDIRNLPAGYVPVLGCVSGPARGCCAVSS
jgi:hypothetical protein